MKRLILAVFLLAAQVAIGAEVELGCPLLGGNQSGVGVLVQYPQDAQGEFVVTRKTVKNSADLGPSYFDGWGKLCYAKLIDPDGKCAGYVDMGLQNDEEQTYRIALPGGKAGIWRLAINGGRRDDVYTIAFPEMGVWGVRGEMGLGITESMPRSMYLYVPEQCVEMTLYQWKTKTRAVLSSDGNELAYVEVREGQANGATFKRITELPKGGVIDFDFTPVTGTLNMTLDGVPFVLCPTPEAAQALKAGVFVEEGQVFQGPLQKRAYDLAHSYTAEQLALPAEYEKKLLNELWRDKEHTTFQEIDPTSPNYGNSSRYSEKVWPQAIARTVNFKDEITANCMYLPFTLAKAYLGAPEEYKPALRRRIVLALCFTARYMQGDDLIRSFYLTGPRPDPACGFDRVYGHAHGYNMIRVDLDEHEHDVLDDFVIAYVDKMIPLTFYQSNQFMHGTMAAYYMYDSLSLPRFKRYTEDKLRIFLTNAYHGKHGQHPSGFYVEDGGPDGHYDYMSMWPISLLYYSYCKRPEADPELCAMIKTSLEKNMYFKSFYAISYPDNSGNYALPYANNHRTFGVFMRDGYPAMTLDSKEFDLAFSIKNINARENPVAPNDSYIKRWGEGGIIYNSLPLTAKRVTLPFEEKSGVWQLPSQIAYKLDCGFYGLSFFHVYQWGHQNGGPLFLWSDRCGLVLSSIRNQHKGDVKDKAGLTFSCVYDESADGKLRFTGRNLNRLEWIEKDKVFTITEQDVKTKNDVVRWTYGLAPDSFTLQAAVLDESFASPVLNLPFYNGKQSKDVVMEIVGDGVVSFRAFGQGVRVTYPAGFAAALETKMDADVQTLRIPFGETRTMSLQFNNGE